MTNITNLSSLDIAALDKEFEDYSSEELEYIHDTQQDVYSKDELAYMLVVADRKKEALHDEAQQYLPNEIECEKCGAPNPYANTICQYCEYPLNKASYEARSLAIAAGEEDETQVTRENAEEFSQSYTFQFVISFLIPLVGLILGAVMLGGEDEDRRQAGKTCIILALVGAAVSGIVFVLTSPVLH